MCGKKSVLRPTHPEPVSGGYHECRAISNDTSTNSGLNGPAICGIEAVPRILAPDTFIPMAGSIKAIFNGVFGIGEVFWHLNVFRILHSLS
jgi:hypothetical protein